MQTTQAMMRELAFHTSQLYFIQKNLSQVLDSGDWKEVVCFVKWQGREIQHRCKRIHDLLDTFAFEGEFCAKIFGSCPSDLIAFNLFLSGLGEIANGPCSVEILARLRMPRVFDGFLKLGCAIPLESFSMFEIETARWIKEGFEIWI
jgi:hypothetical protein